MLWPIMSVSLCMFMVAYSPLPSKALRKHNMMTKQYFRGTCHRNDEALIQIIQKQNRLEHLRDSGALAPKCFEIRCSNCSQTGHNKLTCSFPCQQCNTTYKDHLNLIDGRTVPSCTLETDA